MRHITLAAVLSLVSCFMLLGSKHLAKINVSDWCKNIDRLSYAAMDKINLQEATTHSHPSLEDQKQ